MSDSQFTGPLARLLELGRPETPWPDYPAEYGLTPENIPELIRMATDESAWEEEAESPAVYRNIHAWRALAQLGAVEAVPALVPLLDWIDEYNDDWTGEDLPEALGLIGPPAVPVLAAYLADPRHGLWGRTGAAEALIQIANRHPGTRSESAALIARTLADYRENFPDLNAELVYALSKLKQPDTYPLVQEAFQADRVEISVMGDWEDFQVEVGLLEQRLTEPPDYQHHLRSLFSASPLPNENRPAGDKVDKKAKAKRKMEKRSRKKNRKKKK